MAASFGLMLDPWQAWVLEQSLGENAAGRWAAPEVALLCPRQNGKGSILEARELAGLFLFGEKKITHSAHEAKTAKDHFERMEALLRDAGYGDDKIVFRRSTTEVSILVKSTGCKLMFFTRTESGGRGLGGDVVVLDEAFALTKDQMAALMPTMSARSLHGNPQMWFTSSAGFEYSDVLRGVCQQGIKGSGRLAYFDWSADPDLENFLDRDAWAQANPGLGRRIAEDFVAAEFDHLGPEKFGRERLGLWADLVAGVAVDAEMWAAVCDPESRRQGQVVFAVDAETNRSSASICVAGVNQDGRVHVELIDQRPGISWAAERLKALKEKHQPRAILVNGSGPAGSLIPDLQKMRLNPSVMSPQHMNRARGAFYDAVKDHTLAHHGADDQLLTQGVLNGTAAGIAATLAHYGWLGNRPAGNGQGRRVVVL